jgi:predicted nucleotidyltransferase
MSGSAGGNRIYRIKGKEKPEENIDYVLNTTNDYINKVLKKFPLFKSAKISGSYNTSDKEDFGDIDLIVHLESDNKKNVKLELAKYLSELPDNIIIPFKSVKYKRKKLLNTGEIVTILYPILGLDNQYVQIDNIISISSEELEFKKEFLDYPAEIQGLLLGLAKIACLEEDTKTIFKNLGINNIPELEKNQEYEFNLSSSGLTLRVVILKDFKEIDRTEVWKTTNWQNIKKLFQNYRIDGSFEELLEDLKSKIKNQRSKNRIKGIFNSMVSIKSGEINTPKGDKKQDSINKVNSLLEIKKYLKEGINFNDLTKEKIIKDFIIKCKKDLGMNKLPKITIINDKNWVKNNKSYGSYNPVNKSIMVYFGDRNLADFLRTLSHELTHHWQNENNRIKELSGETGSDIENEANAKAGILLRNYGKENQMIYENKKILKEILEKIK